MSATATTATSSAGLDRVRTAAQRAHDLGVSFQSELELRDRAILDALDRDGHTITEVARAAGLSRTRIFGILARGE